MTRKDYKVIAECFATVRKNINDLPEEDQRAAHLATEWLQSRIASALLRDNPRFDPYRFGKACCDAS